MSAGEVDREAAECTACRAQPGEACEFVDGPAPMVDDNGTRRRAVHAARYAASLPPKDRGPFWENAVESYLSAELERMNATAAPSTSEEP